MTPIHPAIDPALARYREDYPILAHTTYMNSNSMGAMPRSVGPALQRYAEDWARDGVEVWPKWFEILEATADSAARFLGAPAGQTILNQNVAYFQAAVASSLSFPKDRNKVVVEALQFPNVLYVWDRYRELGADLTLVPSDDGMTVPLDRMLAAIDERTAIVPLSHGIYVSGALQDVKAITRRAHEVGALVMVDVYQTAGCVPIDVLDWDVDIAVGGSHKWLCGGPGTAFMWMKPELRERLQPRITGWMGHDAPFSFEPAPIRFAKGHRHFLAGTPSMPAYYAALAAYENLHAIGLPRIRAHNLALSQILIDRAQQAGLTLHSPVADDQRTGFVAVDFATSEAACHQLIAENFKLDWRPGCGLRLGPHFYNTEDEVHRLMDRIVALAGRA